VIATDETAQINRVLLIYTGVMPPLPAKRAIVSVKKSLLHVHHPGCDVCEDDCLIRMLMLLQGPGHMFTHEFGRMLDTRFQGPDNHR